MKAASDEMKHASIKLKLLWKSLSDAVTSSSNLLKIQYENAQKQLSIARANVVTSVKRWDVKSKAFVFDQPSEDVVKRGELAVKTAEAQLNNATKRANDAASRASDVHIRHATSLLREVKSLDSRVDRARQVWKAFLSSWDVSSPAQQQKQISVWTFAHNMLKRVEKLRSQRRQELAKLLNQLNAADARANAESRIAVLEQAKVELLANYKKCRETHAHYGCKHIHNRLRQSSRRIVKLAWIVKKMAKDVADELVSDVNSIRQQFVKINHAYQDRVRNIKSLPVRAVTSSIISKFSVLNRHRTVARAYLDSYLASMFSANNEVAVRAIEDSYSSKYQELEAKLRSVSEQIQEIQWKIPSLSNTESIVARTRLIQLKASEDGLMDELRREQFLHHKALALQALRLKKQKLTLYQRTLRFKATSLKNFIFAQSLSRSGVALVKSAQAKLDLVTQFISNVEIRIKSNLQRLQDVSKVRPPTENAYLHAQEDPECKQHRLAVVQTLDLIRDGCRGDPDCKFHGNTLLTSHRNWLLENSGPGKLCVASPGLKQ